MMANSSNRSLNLYGFRRKAEYEESYSTNKRPNLIHQNNTKLYLVVISITVLLNYTSTSLTIVGTHAEGNQYPPSTSIDLDPSSAIHQTILPPPHLRPKVRVNIHEWATRLSEDIRAVGNRTSCIKSIKRFFESKSTPVLLDPNKLRDNVLAQINILLSQHRAAVSAIVAEAELLAVKHNFVKELRFNYTDVHRVRNELDTNSTDPILIMMANQLAGGNQDLYSSYGAASGNLGSSGAAGTQVPQFTSINGGTPVPGPPEWQTPLRSIIMQVNKNFGDIPVNTSMSAVHLPLPIYPGLPEIMNGIAWTEKLDNVFKRNLAQYAHVHHQYYGDRLGFLRTFPAHKWRIPRTDPDLFDARTRPWYVVGASSPKNVVILVDTSGSMTGLRREIAKGVVFEILDTLTSNDYFSVMRFSETVTPIGFPKCNLKAPKLSLAMEKQCSRSSGLNDQRECSAYARQLDRRKQYLRDHPNVVLGKNGSYMTDDAYQKSIYNVTEEIQDAHMFPATSRNIRYLKSNFSMPTAGIANFTHALMAAFELLEAYSRNNDQGAQCNQAIMLITDGAIRSHEDIFNRFNYPNAPVRVFTYMIGREVGDITHTKSMACNNRGYYTHVINLGEVREQVLKYLAVMARPLVLAHHHPVSWTPAYGDETHQVLTNWVLEIKRRERSRIMLNEERERLNEANSTDVINIELTNIPEYDELPLVDEELKNRIICEDSNDDPGALDQSLHDELDPLGYNDLACHWTTRRADLLTSVVKPVFDNRNETLIFQRVLHKNIWTEQEKYVRNAQLLGIAAVDLRIADILKSVPSHLLGPNGYAILVGQNGFVMHHPDLRALLEDPFDKQSKILKPYFNAVDLTHIEQVYHKNETDPVKRRNDEMKLLKLREAALRGQSNNDSFTVKRAIDCRRRLHIRQQTFYYGPVKDTPFSLILALPTNYGLNRLSAKLDLNQQNPPNFKPSAYDLWTVHPEYKYCESPSLSKTSNNSVSTILEVMSMVEAGSAGSISYEDLTTINSAGTYSRFTDKVICDKELFPALLFDAAATHENPNTFCGSTSFDNCEKPSSSFSNFYGYSNFQKDDLCNARGHEEMRSKLASIYGLEMSFVATRSGLTRVRVFDLSARIKKLADLFIQRHNKAVDEAWYARTVDWNMRFHEDATIITVPYNAYIRLVAKLRQRITQRHPAANDTRANCDPLLDGDDGPQPEDSVTPLINEASTSSIGLTSPSQADIVGSTIENIQNDEPSTVEGAATKDPAEDQNQHEKIDYNEFSSYDFLDLLTNSSVHISATQTVIVNGGEKQRSPVAVSGFLYDYATFARRFLNATSLNIEVRNSDASQQQTKVEICPDNKCPNKCGYRNDTIDCLLLDNNGFIIVGEELPYIGRSLNAYDEKLMQSLVARKVFHQVTLTDFQAICARSAEQVAADQKAAAAGASPASQQLSQIGSSSTSTRNIQWTVLGGLLSNAATSLLWVATTLYSLIFYKATVSDVSTAWTGEPLNWANLVGAQSAVANQSLLALLPNKTYLRPCERTINLYETRPIDFSKLANDSPEYYETKCNCSGWYVYESIPKTNLIMLIVNTTTSCRKCEQPTAPAPALSNFIPVVAPVIDLSGSPVTNVAPAPAVSTQVSGYIGNKTAEDQVCAMLERDSQLYVQRTPPESCYTFNPDEAAIHLCGSANGLIIPHILIATFTLFTSTLIVFSKWPVYQKQ